MASDAGYLTAWLRSRASRRADKEAANDQRRMRSCLSIMLERAITGSISTELEQTSPIRGSGLVSFWFSCFTFPIGALGEQLFV